MSQEKKGTEQKNQKQDITRRAKLSKDSWKKRPTNDAHTRTYARTHARMQSQVSVCFVLVCTLRHRLPAYSCKPLTPLLNYVWQRERYSHAYTQAETCTPPWVRVCACLLFVYTFVVVSRQYHSHEIVVPRSSHQIGQSQRSTSCKLNLLGACVYSTVGVCTCLHFVRRG